MTPSVSVIVPVYGTEKYIVRCARSLFNQSFTDIEYIFINDCTKDNSVNLLEKEILSFPGLNIRIITHEVNKGLPVARERGFKESSGKYVLFVDSDDWVEPDMIERLFSIVEKQGADMVFCDWVEEYRDHKVVHNHQYLGGEAYMESIFHFKTDAYLWNRLVKRTLFSEVEFPKYNMLEDFALTTRLLFNSVSCVYCPYPLYHYSRDIVTSISACEKSYVNHKGRLMNVIGVFDFMGKHSLDKRFPEAYDNMAFSIIWDCLRNRYLKVVGFDSAKSALEHVSSVKLSSGHDVPIFRQIVMKIYSFLVCGLNIQKKN